MILIYDNKLRTDSSDNEKTRVIELIGEVRYIKIKGIVLRIAN